MAVMSGDDSTVTSCIGCGNCSRACTHTDPQTAMLALINIVKDLKVPESFDDTGFVMYPNGYDGPMPVDTGGDVYVMPGCVVKCRAPFIEYAMFRVIGALGMSCSELPGFKCCMYPAQLWSIPEEVREGYRVDMGRSAEGHPIVTLCAGCEELMVRSDVDAVHAIPFIHANMDRLPETEPLGMRVALEPGCTASAYMDMLRDIAERLGCVVVGGSTGCCGKGSKVSGELMRERQDECTGADVIIVGCPMCFIKYDRYPEGLPVMHVSELVACALGDRASLEHHLKRM